MLPLAAAPALLAWTLAIGSCLHQEMPVPALLSAAQAKPDVFAFLGDNVYNDLDGGGMPCEPIDCREKQGRLLPQLWSRLLSVLFGMLSRVFPSWAAATATSVVRAHNARSGARDMEALAAAYEGLEHKPEFRALREAVPQIIATWDDHDYCRNDAGADCPWANESQALFLQFWRGDDAQTIRGGRRGVHEAYSFVAERGRVVRVIVLDTRTWRSDHVLPTAGGATPAAPDAGTSPAAGGARGADGADGAPSPGGGGTSAAAAGGDHCDAADGAGGYCVQWSADATLLGEEQWAWLEEELRQPADVRIICSSISFGSQYNQNGDEVWAIFPREQARMLALLHTTRARGVLFVSGDLHYAELNELGVEHGAPYTLHDLSLIHI